MTTPTSKSRKLPNLFKRNPQNPATYLVRCPHELMAKARSDALARHVTLASYFRLAIAQLLIHDGIVTTIPEAYK